MKRFFFSTAFERAVFAFALMFFLAVGACAGNKPHYTPRLPCPDLPLLPDEATHQQLVDHDAEVVRMYGECRKARRVNPRQE